MKKTYQTPVATVVDIAVESQILAESSLGFGDGSIDDPSRADAPGMRYIMDDEEEEDEDDGSYWK
ncbi:hypothetical protein [Leyella stercorea]|uniref:hypothetical protein n=1 Tax=Leyella stercorea TaxID=363265 RepID=UPI0026DB296F|nr:hypothetical protein [Leyella stercorea]